METGRPLFIPVILGTARMGRMSLHAAQLVTGELGKRAGIETNLIDIANLSLPTNDAGEAIKQSDFSAKMNEQGGRVGGCVAGVQPRLLRSLEARSGQLSQGIHS
jgi:hypothetical protein